MTEPPDKSFDISAWHMCAHLMSMWSFMCASACASKPAESCGQKLQKLLLVTSCYHARVRLYVTCAEYLINFGGSATSTASNAMHRMPHNSSGSQNVCCSPSQSWPVGSCSLRQPLDAPIAVQIHAGKLKPLHVWPVHCCNSQCCHATPIIMCRNVAICPKIHAELLQLWPSWSCCGQHLTTLRPVCWWVAWPGASISRLMGRELFVANSSTLPEACLQQQPSMGNLIRLHCATLMVFC